MTKLNYILISIIIILSLLSAWLYFDYEPPKKEPTENEKMVEAINILNQKLNILESFLTQSFPDKVKEFQNK